MTDDWTDKAYPICVPFASFVQRTHKMFETEVMRLTPVNISHVAYICFSSGVRLPGSGRNRYYLSI
jgi:hypothetical protein